MAGVVKRSDFIQNLVNSQGFTYVQASGAFDSFMKTIEDGICSGDKIQLSKIGAIVPTKLNTRAVKMGFRKAKGNMIVPESRVYFIGNRIKYKFRLFKNFMKVHAIDWNLT